MKNREKFREDILSFVLRGNGEAYCEFVKKNVLPNLMDYTNGECDEVYSCGLCRAIFAFWLDEEYTEPSKPEVDWSKVPVDTLVRVRDYEDDEWVLRYFAGIDEETPKFRFLTWDSGATSITVCGNYTHWKYCELVEDAKDKRTD